MAQPQFFILALDGEGKSLAGAQVIARDIPVTIVSNFILPEVQRLIIVRKEDMGTLLKSLPEEEQENGEASTEAT